MRKYLLIILAVLLGYATADAQWYLVGANFGWSDAAANQFEATAEANVFTKSVASLSGTFKVKEKGTWSTSFGSNGSKLKADTDYKAVKDGGDITVDGTIANAVITINTSTYTVRVTGKSAENEYDVVYLVGDFGSGWNEATTTYPLTLAAGTTDKWTGEYELKAATTYFKMKAGSLVYGTGGSDIAVETGTDYTAAQSGNAFSLGAGKYKFTFVLAKNADTGVLTVSQDGPVTYPEHIYAVGNFNDKDFAADVTTMIPAASEAGHYEGDIVLTGAMGTDSGYFQLATGSGSNASDWPGLGTRYGASEADEVPGETPVSLTSNDFSWKLPVGTYTVSVNLVDKTMTVKSKENPQPPVPDNPVLYLRGDISGWAATDACKFTEADNVYTLSIPKLSGDFKIAEAEWNDETTTSTDLLDMETGVAYEAKQYPGIANMAMKAAAIKNVTVTYDRNAQTVKVDGTPYTPVTDYVINSSLETETWSVIEMTQAEGLWTMSVTPAVLEGELQVVRRVDGVNAEYLGSTEALSPENKVITMAAGAANAKYSGLPADKQITLTFDPAALTLTLAVNDTPVVEYPELFFNGEINDFGSDPMTCDNGVYTIELPLLNGYFVLEGEDFQKYTMTTARDDMELDTEYDVVNDWMAGNMEMAKRIKDAVITFDYNTMKLKVTGTVDDSADVITYWIKGSWNSYKEAELIKVDDSARVAGEKYSYTTTLTTPSGRFSIYEKLNGVPTRTFWKAPNEDPMTASNPSITLSTENRYSNLTYNFSDTNPQSVTFVFEPATGMLTADFSTTGIDGVIAGEAPARYFNMQGVEVENPAPGLYIVVRGDKASKEYVR